MHHLFLGRGGFNSDWMPPCQGPGHWMRGDNGIMPRNMKNGGMRDQRFMGGGGYGQMF